MSIREMKDKLHELVEKTDNENLLDHLLAEAQPESTSLEPHELEGLSKEDYDELVELANEPTEKDVISEEEFKESIKRWLSK